MRKILQKVIKKWPLKVLFITLIAIASMAIFVSKISLSTGNETLINTNSETYQDNYSYQVTFGTDPIIIVFSGDDQESLLAYNSLSTINNLVESVKGLDGIFYVNSPIGIIDYATSNSYTNYQTALSELSSGLLTMSDSINNMTFSDDSFDSDTLLTTFNTLSTAQETLSENFTDEIDVFSNMKTTVSNEIDRLETIKDTLDPVNEQSRIVSITQTVQILTNVNGLYSQLILMNTNLAAGATQTANALNQISTQMMTIFTSVSTMKANMNSLATNLETMGISLGTLSDNFNMFTGAFPTSSETLNMMVHQDGGINPMIEMFMIDETHMYLNIILEESVTNENIEAILLAIDESLEGTIHEEALVSGKPVLNYDIQSTMMDSMKIMMISAGIIMVLILLVLFPVKARLLPLLVVLLAVVTTVGIMGIFSIPLTMVSMAVFPVLIGLGIDYSIQFQNRYMEEEFGGVVDEK